MIPIPERLKRARRVLDELSQVSLLQDWTIDSERSQWYIRISITIEYTSQYINRTTEWYVVVSSVYPYGPLKIYPSITNSISATFQHQSNNTLIDKNGLWRMGSLCTEKIDRIFEKEPYDEEIRLFYHVKRACVWLESAAKGTLVNNGDLFELPSFDTSSLPLMRFIFSEDLFSYMQWDNSEYTGGIASLSTPYQGSDMYHVLTFESISRSVCHHVDWGNNLNNTPVLSSRALWLMLEKCPVANVWQAPSTFGELKEICYDQGLDLIGIFEKMFYRIRDGKRHFLLVGFPIPKYIHGENQIIFWQALLLPVLSYGKQTHPGFRTGELGWWIRDNTQILKDNLKLDWIISENWSENAISERGAICGLIRSKKVAIIGCGCLGASIAEMLTRSGTRKITLIDNDIAKVSNLSRHVLSIHSIGCNKSESLKNRLNSINPHASVEHISEYLCMLDESTPSIDLSVYDIIIDCTGEDYVLNVLHKATLKKTASVLSVSIGLNANRVYIALQRGPSVDFDKFLCAIFPYIFNESKSAEEIDLPRDGIGCWHATFPARIYDVYPAASIAIKTLETYFESHSSISKTLIFESAYQNGFWTGYTIIEDIDHE